MNRILLCSTIIIVLFCASACSKEQVVGVMDDIARDTYEKKAREQRIENLGNPAYEPPPTYDQYQRERKKLISKEEASTEQKMIYNRFNPALGWETEDVFTGKL